MKASAESRMEEKTAKGLQLPFAVKYSEVYRKSRVLGN
jgi:hypothetical protein